MGRIDICRSDSLSHRVEELILEAGGRAGAVLALMEHASPGTAAPADGAADGDCGPPTVLVLRLTSEEARAIEAAHTARGMSRGEWVRALLRRQLSDQRPLGRVDRSYLRRSLEQLQGLRQELMRIRAAVTQAGLSGRDVEAPMRGLGALERTLIGVAEAIRQGFLGEDRYWRRLERADDPRA